MNSKCDFSWMLNITKCEWIVLCHFLFHFVRWHRIWNEFFFIIATVVDLPVTFAVRGNMCQMYDWIDFRDAKIPDNIINEKKEKMKWQNEVNGMDGDWMTEHNFFLRIVTARNLSILFTFRKSLLFDFDCHIKTYLLLLNENAEYLNNCETFNKYRLSLMNLNFG